MGICESKITKNEISTAHKPIPLKIANKVMKSICKIIIKTEKGIFYGTGFFLNYSEQLKYLITNYHVINPSIENENIQIEIYNKKTMKLDLNNRLTKYFKKPKDIAIIEIKESDNIYKDIEFLDYDINYIKKGYLIYEGLDIFSVEHPFGEDASCASGQIINICDYEFEHNISTDNGSSGCPIILLNNSILIQVIGIHKEGIISKNLNGGTFIGEIFNERIKPEKESNYIIAEIFIKEKYVNKDIRIINSYEEMMRNTTYEFIKDDKFKNEDEIKKCEIEINGELIPFNYFHKFKSKGKYAIKYSFKNKIKNACLMFGECKLLLIINLNNFNTYNISFMNCMFYECSSLQNIELSNINTNNLTNMISMFDGCSSLIKINLSNFYTNNVEYIYKIFKGCSSLISINLSNFNTSKITSMNGMFYGCSSLNKLDLSSFNTNNVINMCLMFYGCSSLTNLDLSNFNTNKVTTMDGMFYGCSSLIDINMSHFNTNKVSRMGAMFYGCSSLTSLDLSNFYTDNVTDMSNMFYGCNSLTKIFITHFNINKFTELTGMFGKCVSLKKENIIIKDKSIFNNNELFSNKSLY